MGTGLTSWAWCQEERRRRNRPNFISQTAFLWDRDLNLVNLGTLGGGACPGCSSEAVQANIWGEAAIFSETASPAYKGEDFCAFGTHRQCLGAIWKDGVMRALSPLSGGYNGQAVSINDLGQVSGFRRKWHRRFNLRDGYAFSEASLRGSDLGAGRQSSRTSAPGWGYGRVRLLD